MLKKVEIKELKPDQSLYHENILKIKDK